MKIESREELFKYIIDLFIYLNIEEDDYNFYIFREETLSYHNTTENCSYHFNIFKEDPSSEHLYRASINHVISYKDYNEQYKYVNSLNDAYDYFQSKIIDLCI